MLGVFLFVGVPSQSPSGDSVSPAASGAVCQWQTSSTDRRGSGNRPLGNVPPGRSGPQGGSQVGAPPKACRKLSLASPLGGGGLALARTEGARCQRPPRMGCVEALAGCPLSRLTATAPPKGEPSLASPFGARKKVLPAPDAKKDTRRHRMSCFYRARGGLRPPRSPS